MEYCPGGDLFSVLRGVGRLNENAAAIYTSQIVAALEFLRFNSVIHRDLKPDNILVCSNGRLKLTDFGLSVFGSYERSITETNDSNDSTESFGSIVGTPDYISPEIILQQKHSFTADYWSLGCIVYEFLVGVPPFHQDTPTETFARALNGIYEPLQSFHNDNISEEAIDFVSRLLQQDPSKRLGYKSIEEIKQHPWFAKNDIDWHNLDKLIPPFVPQLDNDEDTSYFEERYQWKDDNEQDILEDITVSSLNLSRKMSSSFFSENNPNYSFTDPDDDLSSFPSLSTGSLNSLNKVETEKKRRSLRASSFSEKNLWPNTPLDEENSVLIESKPKQYDATPRKKPKQRKKYALNATSHSFFEKLVISPTSKCNKSDEF
ncbi:AGC family protein kinase [Tritrichomonas foetus]|uniref:non-specific serine/threonine protein kinase n=1 Tax=Tritrichomonas foetus TaxID=1144522 RepID=A0A1J4JQK7_9EUKA|nr:AGC family protein kinase [Tritrichomonas foetus]|eukprot:OHS99805.1 AGC family protein kinase [Tritrichomonas foetus]